MKTSNKIFLIIAGITAISLTYAFVDNGMQLQKGGVLGQEDSMSIDDLNFADGELENSLDELDAYLDSELDDELDSLELDDDLSFEGELDQEIEKEISQVEYDLDVSTSQQTTRKTTKLQRLFFLVPVEIETEETVTDSGLIVSQKQTLLGKLLDLFSF